MLTALKLLYRPTFCFYQRHLLATTTTMGLDAIADVDIDGSGKFKYILIQVTTHFWIQWFCLALCRPKMLIHGEKIWCEAMLVVK